MRPIVKFGLAVIALCGLLQAALIAALVWPLRGVGQWLRASWLDGRWVLLGLTAISALVFLTLLLVALFRRSSSKDLVVNQKRGRVVVTKKAVENSLTKALAAAHPVVDIQSRVKLRRHAVAEASIQAESLDSEDLTGTGEAMAETATHNLATLLGVEVKKVRVHLTPPDNARARRVPVV